MNIDFKQMDWFEKDNVKAILPTAKQYGWNIIAFQPNIKMVSFGRPKERINLYYSKMTVSTCIEHPTKGKTQLFRKHLDLDGIKKIFANPRTHTGFGYYQK